MKWFIALAASASLLVGAFALSAPSSTSDDALACGGEKPKPKPVAEEEDDKPKPKPKPAEA